jgi:hypothetical protein
LSAKCAPAKTEPKSKESSVKKREKVSKDKREKLMLERMEITLQKTEISNSTDS